MHVLHSGFSLRPYCNVLSGRPDSYRGCSLDRNFIGECTLYILGVLPTENQVQLHALLYKNLIVQFFPSILTWEQTSMVQS